MGPPRSSPKIKTLSQSSNKIKIPSRSPPKITRDQALKEPKDSDQTFDLMTVSPTLHNKKVRIQPNSQKIETQIIERSMSKLNNYNASEDRSQVLRAILHRKQQKQKSPKSPKRRQLDGD